MPEKTGKNLKLRLVVRLVGTTLLGVLVVLVVIVYFNTALGWFANNKNVSGTGMSVKVEAMDAEAEYFAYIYDIKKGRVIFTGDTSLSADEQDPRIDYLDMQFHDTIFDQRNRYTPAVIRIRLTDIKSEWLNGGVVNLTIARNTSFPVSATKNGYTVLSDYFTSIMRFTVAQDPDWYDLYNVNADTPQELYFNIDEDMYATVKDMTVDTADSKVFTTATVDADREITSVVKENSIVLSVSYSDTDIVDGHLDVYLYLTYDKNLTYTYEHQMGGLDTGTTAIGNVSIMRNDMASIVVSFSSGS